MAVIVKHRETEERHVLVGIGFGAYKATKPNWSLRGRCLPKGCIGGFIQSNSLTLLVVSIVGEAPEIVLGTE